MNRLPMPDPFEPGLLHIPEDITKDQAWEIMLRLITEAFPEVKSHGIIATAAVWGVWFGARMTDADANLAFKVMEAGDSLQTLHFNAGKKVLSERFTFIEADDNDPSVELRPNDGQLAVDWWLSQLRGEDA